MSYKVTIQPSGHEYVLAENETVLDGALRNGIMFPYSCRGGSCGTCFGKVLSGDIDFPDGALLGALQKGTKVIRPNGDTKIDDGDTVVIFCLAKDVAQVETLFQVQVDFF